MITADSARPETVSYMRRNGYPKIAPAVKGPGSVEDGVEWLRGFDIVVHPRCENVIRELARYAWEIDDHTGKPTSKLAEKDNHTIDALRYAYEAQRRAQCGEPAGFVRDNPDHRRYATDPVRPFSIR